MFERINRAMFAPLGQWFGERSRSRTGAVRQPVVVGLSILVIIGSAVSLYVTHRPSRLRANVQRHIALGEVLAEETAGRLGGKGEIVLVVLDSRELPNPATDVELRAFTRKIKKLGGITVVATEQVQPSESMAILLPEMALPGAKYRELIAQYGGVDAVVSFMGVPFLKNEEIVGLPQTRPQFIAVSGPAFGNHEMKRLFEAQLLQLAIIPRSQPAPFPTTEPETTRDLFRRYYQVVTAETYTSIPNPGDPLAPETAHAPLSETASEK